MSESESETDVEDGEGEQTTTGITEGGIASPDGTEEDDETATEANSGNGALDALKERRTWSFEVKAPNGTMIEMAGSDPDSDDGVADLTSPAASGSLLYWRAIEHLHDAPEITRDEWNEFNPRMRGIIATRHFDEFGLGEFMSDDQMDAIMNALGEQADRDADQSGPDTDDE